jgi:protocatechuate 3,4-dioxygenase beta subunit
MKKEAQSRREFIKIAAFGSAFLPFLVNCRADVVAQKSEADVLKKIRLNTIQNDGEWNGAKDAPDSVSSKTRLIGTNDKGEMIVISGTVFKADGKTPAPNVLIYIYHTDSNGIYGREGEHRHGRYRGWLLTDAKGAFEFETIKPAPYPERRFAAHIHMTITTAELTEDWIDSILFEGDKLISARERTMAGKKGGFNPIIALEKDAAGVWRGRRDIQLWK